MKVLHLISGGDKGGAKTHVFALLAGLLEDIDIKVVCFMEGVFYNEIKNTEIPYVLIKQKFRYDLTVVNKLVKLIRQERYNLIHAHGARANFIAMFLKNKVGIPIITTVHSDYKLDFTQNLYKKLIFTELNAVSLRFIDYYIAVSENFKNMLVERKFPKDKIYTVYNAIDFNQQIKYMPKEDFIKKYNIPNDKILVGIIGRFDKVKGHDVFVKACAEVLKHNKNVIFLLAGEGDEQSNLENLATKLGVRDNLIFLGFINDIYSFINTIDINVLSSYSESFPYVLLEGAYLKKATVSTAVGGIPDLIKNEHTGLLAENANHVHLGKQILNLVNDKDKRKTLGENLFTFAKSNFSRDSLKNRHLEIYKSVIQIEKEQANLFDVMLSGYYGFNNSGDEAILEAIISELRKQKEDISIIVLSKKPQITMEQYNVFSVSRYDFLKINKYLKRTRVFISGGGNLLQDITSTHSLFYYTYLMMVAKKFGLKQMLYANGIGPIKKEVNIKRATEALKLCDYITLREPESFHWLEKLNIDLKNVLLSADPTLNTKKVEDTEVKQILKLEGIDPNKKYFALSFRQWKYNDPEFVDKISKAIDDISDKYNIVPLFIPMQYPNDQIISNEIIKKTKTKCCILKKEYSVKQLLGVISKMNFVISMRLHTLIYALNVNVPIVGIVYDPKIKSFMDYINMDYYINTKNIDIDNLKNMIDKIQIDYNDIKINLEKQSLKLKEVCKNDPVIAVSLI